MDIKKYDNSLNMEKNDYKCTISIKQVELIRKELLFFKSQKCSFSKKLFMSVYIII